MAVYPGNSALSTAVKDRVLSTFQQTVALFKQGRTEEVVQGCGLILRMDPLFDPAKKLMEKARNPAAPINVDTLIANDPIAEARAAMTARNFQKVVDITTEILTNDLMNEEARVLNESAREKMEAAPFVDQFVKKAEAAIAKGDAAAAKASLDKLKTLDADDTAIARLESGISNIKPAAPKGSSSSSFIVDTPAAGGGRNSAQASDFGFTFEEEKAAAPTPPPQSFSFDSPFSTDTGTVPSITPPASFSFDEPSRPAPKPAAPQSTSFSFDTPPPSPSQFSPPSRGASGDFDFTTASVETSPDDQKKVQEYLSEGDRAFDAGQLQQAIDLWSRIFLIDVTNEQASERIEKAKMRRREVDQKGEALLATGIQAFDRGDRDAARDSFQKLLQIDPHNPTAQEYMEKLSEVATEGGATGFAAPYIAPKPSAASPPPADIWSDDAVTSDALVPPPAAPTAARKPAAKTAPKAAPASAASSGSAMRAIVIVVVLAVLAGVGWFGWKKFMAKPAVDTAATEAVFTSANSLSQKGQYDAAIALLQDVKPNDPQHDKALSMIADLRAKKNQATELVTGRPSDAVYRDSLATGRSAFDARDYDAAKKALDAAARIKPLPPDMKSMYDTASQQVAKLEGAKALFNSQKYQDALTNLQSLAQQDPQNQSIRRMIADSHFNLGAVALQEERLPEAAREFDDVLKIDPSDELAKRSKTLAERYDGQPKDLLYRIYVKYLPMRKVT